MRTWRLLMIGFGTVGRGTAERLLAAADALRGEGCDPMIRAVVDPVAGSVGHPQGLDAARLVAMAERGESLDRYPDGEDPGSACDAIASDDVDVVLEMTPTDLRTAEPALTHVRTALLAGRHVITSNKGPVALAADEVASWSRAGGARLLCEATVMAGTPVLNLARAGLVGAGIRGIRGVLNGTCNFILSSMQEGREFDEALATAQRLGYAEADPRGDVDGWDAAAKVAILANLLLDAGLRFDEVAREGIGGLDAAAVRAAAARGRRWRLLGRIEREGAGWRASVGPVELAAEDPLARVGGVDNALVFDTEALGEVTIAGPGAGRAATGHAMVADLLALHRAEAREW